MNRFVILIALVVIVAIAWSAGWLYVAGRVEAEIAAFETADGYTQPRIACGDLAVGGFPFQFRPRCTEASIVTGDITVELARLDAAALFYRPTHIQFFAQGPARISDDFLGTVQEVSWQDLRGSLRLDGDRIGRLSLVASQIAHADALLGTTVLTTADDLEVHLVAGSAAETPTAGDVLDIYVLLDGANAHAFEVADGTLTLDARVTGLPPPSLLAAPDALMLWQANGGAVTLRGLDVHAEDLVIEADGEIHLDSQGRLNGTVALDSEGLAGRLETVLDPTMVEFLLGSPDAEGRAHQTITANEGTLQAGLLPFQTVPPLF